MSTVGAAPPDGASRTTYAGLAAVEIGAPGGLGTALLVPGFTGSKEDFFPLLPCLPGLRVVCVDLPGQYESVGPDEPAAYSVAALARAVLGVAQALGEPVHLVGHSFGGLVCRAAVLARPTAVLDLTLMSSGPAGLTGPRTDNLAFLRPLLEQGGLPAVAAAMDAMELADPVRVQVPDALRQFLRTRFLACSPTGLLAMGEALVAEPDRVVELAATGVPLLVLYGEHDDAWSPALQADMAVRLRAQQMVLPHAAHSPAAEQPEATAQALLRFWSRHPPLVCP